MRRRLIPACVRCGATMGLQLTDTYHSLLKAVPRPPPLVSDLGDVLGGLALSKKRASAKQNNLKPRLSGRWWTGATHHRSSSWSSTLVNDEIELQDSEIWSTQMDDQNLSVVLEYVVSDFFKEIADMGSQEIEPKELLLKTGNDIRIVVEHVPQENPIMH